MTSDPTMTTARLPVQLAPPPPSVDHSVMTARPTVSMMATARPPPPPSSSMTSATSHQPAAAAQAQADSQKPVEYEEEIAEEEKKGPKGIEDQNVLIRCVAEFLATIIFVFAGVLQTQSASIGDSIVHSALVHGLAITFLGVAFGRLSGGYVNPAVTCGVALVGRLAPIPATCYVISQLAGSLVGALLTRAVFTQSTVANLGATVVTEPFSWYHALIAESVATFFLVLVVLLTAVDTKKNVLAPLAIGMTISINILAIGKVSGGSLNPARSFGPNVVGSIFLDAGLLPTTFWIWHAIYYGGPLIGAMTAAGIFRLCFARQSRLVK